MVDFADLRRRYIKEVRDSILEEREINRDSLKELSGLGIWGRKVMEELLVEYADGVRDHVEWLGDDGFRGQIVVAEKAIRFYRENFL